MAFRGETEAVYKRLIRPAIVEAGLTPVRVDKIVHNEPIDRRILKELDKCQVALADLTFNRPSVYFEAGYAERKVPLVLTAREDHLQRDSPESVRVHFDLQNRNIVGWRSDRDNTAKKELIKRLRFVVRPLLQRAQQTAESKRNESDFERLSFAEQQIAMENAVKSSLKKSGYREFEAKPSRFNIYYGILEELGHQMVFYQRKQVDSMLLVQSLVPLNKDVKTLAKAVRFQSEQQREWLGENETKSKLRFSRHVVVCAKKRISRELLAKALPHFGFDTARQVFVGTDYGRTNSRNEKYFFNVPVEVHLLDGVVSIQDLIGRLRELVLVLKPLMSQRVKSPTWRDFRAK
jgi:nucleoside 2-deoxyribosyltransferase